MSERERELEARLRMKLDRHAYRWARAVTRSVLSRYTAVEPRALEFVPGPSGKPEIATAIETPLQFSLAHTDGMTTLLVGDGRVVGVDVESERRLATGRLPLSVLGSRELARLNRSPAEQRPVRLLEHWTLKEAYAKACGRGLELPLDRVEFVITGRRINARFDARFGPDPRPWWFALPEACPGYVIALAAGLHGEGEGPLELQTFSAGAA